MPYTRNETIDYLKKIEAFLQTHAKTAEEKELLHMLGEYISELRMNNSIHIMGKQAGRDTPEGRLKYREKQREYMRKYRERKKAEQ